jgi:transposase
MTQSGYKKRHCQPSSAQALFEHLKKHYPGGVYQAVYESGFSGFSTCYALQSCGINCTVIHAAYVPSTQYDKVMKSDPIDSEKLVKALKAGILRGIYIPRKENLDDRGVMRFRKVLQIQLGGYKSRVKHLLYNNGVALPECFSSPGTHWSKRFMRWLREDAVLLSPQRNSLELLLGQVELFRKNLLGATRRIRAMSEEERYAVMYNNLRRIPGIGMITAMCLLTEIDDPSRFHNEKQFASYLGLIPSNHSSGEKKIQREKTFRGNKHLGPMLIESSWTAIRHDGSLAASFGEYCKRMKSLSA